MVQPAKKPQNWTEVLEETDSASNLTVRLTMNDAKFPGFSMELGRLPREGSEFTGLSRHVSVRWIEKNGKVELESSGVANALYDLGLAVEAKMLELAQVAADARAEERIGRERQSANRGVQAAPPGLKKLGKIDAARKGENGPPTVRNDK